MEGKVRTVAECLKMCVHEQFSIPRNLLLCINKLRCIRHVHNLEKQKKALK